MVSDMSAYKEIIVLPYGDVVVLWQGATLFAFKSSLGCVPLFDLFQSSEWVKSQSAEFYRNILTEKGYVQFDMTLDELHSFLHDRLVEFMTHRDR